MTEFKPNEIVQKLLDIDLLINSVESFIPIKWRIESLDPKSPAYHKFDDYVDKVLNILKAFAEAGLIEKETDGYQSDKEKREMPFD